MSSLKKTMAMPLLLLLGLLLSASIASTLTVPLCPVASLALCAGASGSVPPNALCCTGIGQLVQINATVGPVAANNCVAQVTAIVGPLNITMLEGACFKAPPPCH
ncbi:hypothetical protein SLA2020_040430 [Shorea laevis]